MKIHRSHKSGAITVCPMKRLLHLGGVLVFTPDHTTQKIELWTHVVLRVDVVQVRCLPKVVHGAGEVALHPLAEPVHEPQVEVRGTGPLLRRLAEPLGRHGVVHHPQLPSIEHHLGRAGCVWSVVQFGGLVIEWVGKQPHGLKFGEYTTVVSSAMLCLVTD